MASRIEAAYVGRRGRDLLIRRDLAMPMDIVDPKSGVNYFTAAQQLINAYRQAGINSSAPASFLGIGAIPYWENMFPGAAGVVTASGQTVTMTATQRMARLYFQNDLDWTTGAVQCRHRLQSVLQRSRQVCVLEQPVLAAARAELDGDADYNSLQLTMRKRWTDGYQFDVNYTLSKSTDLGSAVERGQIGLGGYSGFLLNSWEPDLQYSYSDFDVRHQMNLNWVADLPFGRTRADRRRRAVLVESDHRQLAVRGRLPVDERVPFQHHQLAVLLADQLELSGQRRARG